jgi:hypothetical protein
MRLPQTFNTGKNPKNMSLYQSEDWLSLDAQSRAELLLVIECVKRGATTSLALDPFLRVIRQTPLAYRKIRKKGKETTLRIGPPHILQQYEQTMDDAKSRDDEHRASGWFHNYPECCIEQYISPPTAQDRKARTSRYRFRSWRFGREMEQKILAEGTYPDVFNYRPPAFTPCSIDCEDATTLLQGWKDLLELHDKAAAGALVAFNKQHMPEKLAHSRPSRIYYNTYNRIAAAISSFLPGTQ